MLPDAKLPAQIQAEVDRAEAIEREIHAALNPQPEPESVNEQTQEVPAQEEQAPQEYQEAAQAPPVEDPNGETWQTRYRVLQGKYNAEVPRYAAQLREAQQRIQQLEALAQRPEPPAQPEHNVEAQYAEAVDMFGEDLVQFTRKMAQAEAERRIAEIRDSLQQVNHKVSQSEQDRFFSQVDAVVPNWRQIDTDPAWLGWLQEYDPLLGTPRQAALEQAAAAHDVQRVAHLFQLFQGSRTPASRPAPAAPTRAQLEQVTPRPTGSATATTAGARRIYTQGEITQLLDPRNFNRLPREQQVALERDIDLAVVEGRIAA